MNICYFFEMIYEHENLDVVNIERHVNSEIPSCVNIVNSFNKSLIRAMLLR